MKEELLNLKYLLVMFYVYVYNLRKVMVLFFGNSKSS